MSETVATTDAQAGDWIEVKGSPGWPAKRGRILEVMGHPGHVHFRVRWDAGHESIVYPGEGTVIVHHGARRKPAGRR